MLFYCLQEADDLFIDTTLPLSYLCVLGTFALSISGPLLDNGFPLRCDNLLRAAVEFGVLDEAIAVCEPGSALGTTVCLFPLKKRQKKCIRKAFLVPYQVQFIGLIEAIEVKEVSLISN